MITPTSFKIKVSGEPKTIDTVIDTDPTKDNIENYTKDLFEPRTNNRFLVKILDDQNNDIVPSFLIKEFNRPELTSAMATSFSCIIYDSVTQRVVALLMPFLMPVLENKIKVILQITDPIGNIIETWTFKNVTLKKVSPSLLNWSDDDVSLIYAEFRVSYSDITIEG
jgi:hypothetical protein